MDTSALTTLVPAGGLGATLLLVLGYVLKQIPADRGAYREDIAAERARTAAAEARTAEALEREAFAQLQIDEERHKRRVAESAAAAAESLAANLRLTIEWHAAERARLLGVIAGAPDQEGNP